ncbi:MAG: hypothetical protein ABIR55_00755 [Burkholderiaceae bacterium]
MSAIDHLVEQRILESESHLRHVDELMAKAQAVRASAKVSQQTAARLAQIEQDHHRVSEEVRSLRKAPAPDAAERSKGLKSVLQTLGLELEKTLTAIGDKPDH